MTVCPLSILYTLEDQAAVNMTDYISLSPDTELTSPFLILLMPSVSLGSDKYQ